MDVNTAVQLVLKKALAHDGVARGLNETARALEKGEAQLAILADDCNQPDYKKLVEALCKEHGTPLLSVPEAKQLGQWAGVSPFPSLSPCSASVYIPHLHTCFAKLPASEVLQD